MVTDFYDLLRRGQWYYGFWHLHKRYHVFPGVAIARRAYRRERESRLICYCFRYSAHWTARAVNVIRRYWTMKGV